ncbi:hypothetical protein LZ31DRAFT_557173, partial [Colletotrichum somersetense]
MHHDPDGDPKAHPFYPSSHLNLFLYPSHHRPLDTMSHSFLDEARACFGKEAGMSHTV